jgi:hypothetical protein
MGTEIRSTQNYQEKNGKDAQKKQNTMTQRDEASHGREPCSISLGSRPYSGPNHVNILKISPPATWEAEIGRIAVQAGLGKKPQNNKSETLFEK